MTAAELKTLRESLGLTTQWVADQAGVKLRTAQYWEMGGRMAVPGDVAEMLIAIDQQIDNAVTKSIDLVKEVSKKNGYPKEVALVRYRNNDDLWQFKPDMKPLPASSHAVLLSRTRRALWAINIHSIIEYMEPEEYLGWLGKKKDTEITRALWASERAGV